MDASGGGLMMRMDNGLIDWWNPAQQRLMQTSEYALICQDVKQTHGELKQNNVPRFSPWTISPYSPNNNTKI